MQLAHECELQTLFFIWATFVPCNADYNTNGVVMIECDRKCNCKSTKALMQNSNMSYLRSDGS